MSWIFGVLICLAVLGSRGRGIEWIGDVLGLVVGDVLRVRRRHVEAAMGVAGIPAPSATARSMYRSLGRGLVELLWLVARPGQRQLPVVLVPPEVLSALVGPGRGAVVATAHTGNWDVVACGVAAQTPLSVVTKRLSVRALDRVWQGSRRARGVTLLEAGSASGAVAAALARGELVAMLVDQAPERERGAIRIPFLGALAWVDLAPALCALRARVPLVVAFPHRLPDGTHTIHIEAVLSPPDRAQRRWAVEAMTTATALLEGAVRRHPEQWLWMHRRWKDAAPGRARRTRSGSDDARRESSPLAAR